MTIFKKLINFLKEVQLEVKKVSWPTTQQTVTYTLIVIGVSVVVAALLGGMDFIYTFALNKFIIK